MNELKTIILGIIFILIGIRGCYGLFLFTKGEGDQFFYWPWFKRVEDHRRGSTNWLTQYTWWKAGIMWVGTKKNPNHFERFYLFIGSLGQIGVGVVGLILLWQRLF